MLKAPLAYLIRKIILVQTYNVYPKNMIHDDEMIARMLHLLLDKNKLLGGKSVQSVKKHTAEYMIDNTNVEKGYFMPSTSRCYARTM